VNDTVAWSANKLTLDARANINVNAPMNGSGTAQLAFIYGQSAVAAGNTARLNVRAPVTLPSGSNFSTTLGSDGSVMNYTVITNMTDLQAINSNLTGNFALGSDLNASGFSGYVPIGSSSTPFFSRTRTSTAVATGSRRRSSSVPRAGAICSASRS
jgi:hypothetical protein